jgi:hypothetical protein
MNRVGVALLGVIVLLAGFCSRAVGEVFLLVNGSRVEGQLLNPDESPRERFVILTPGGTRITLERSQVKKILHQSPAEVEYGKVRHRYPDTVDGQWALAEWCREKGLADQRRTHLERILELAPDHPKARAALNYIRHEDEWLTREELMTRRGMVRHGGLWRYPQELELLRQEQYREQSEAEWLKKLRMWRGWLGTERDLEARKEILAIRDAYALKALADALERDDRRAARALYAEALGNLQTRAARMALARAAMEDPSPDARLACIEQLRSQPDPAVVAYFVGQLESKENGAVHRAAVGLSALQDPSSVPALIDALVTTHKRTGGGGQGSISPSFGIGPGGSPGPGGLAVGGRPKVIKFDVANQPVLDALLLITGQNFAFNEPAWKAWYSESQTPEDVDLRRD